HGVRDAGGHLGDRWRAGVVGAGGRGGGTGHSGRSGGRSAGNPVLAGANAPRSSPAASGTVPLVHHDHDNARPTRLSRPLISPVFGGEIPTRDRNRSLYRECAAVTRTDPLRPQCWVPRSDEVASTTDQPA